MAAELFVLDTSAVLALTDDEPGAETVEALLHRAEKGAEEDTEKGDTELLLSTVSLMEVYYLAVRRHGEAAGARLVATLKVWPVRWVEPTERILLQAGRLKAYHRLSLADAIIAASAVLTGAVLVHKDPEFRPLEPQLLQQPLPMKPDRRSATPADGGGRRGS